MYATKKRAQAARSRRFKAILFTLTFHLVLLAGIVYSIDSDFTDLLPDFVKELLFDSNDGMRSPRPKAWPVHGSQFRNSELWTVNLELKQPMQFRLNLLHNLAQIFRVIFKIFIFNTRFV